MHEKYRSVWLWVVALGLGVPALYVASFGPACWVTGRTERGAVVANVLFQPLMRGVCRGAPYSGSLGWYSKLASAPDWEFTDLNDLTFDGDVVWGKVEGTL